MLVSMIEWIDLSINRTTFNSAVQLYQSRDFTALDTDNMVL